MGWGFFLGWFAQFKQRPYRFILVPKSFDGHNWLMLCGVFLAIATYGADKVTHPAMGSSERKAVLDAVRPLVKTTRGEAVKFVVEWIAVKKDLAVVYCSPENQEFRSDYFNMEGDIGAAFVKRVDGKWKLKAFMSDLHEGFGPEQGGLIDLSGLKTRGYTKDLFAPKKQDENVWVLSLVRELGYAYVMTVDSDPFVPTAAEIARVRQADSSAMVRKYDCFLLEPAYF
jgi:hypothetical protein